MAHYSPEMCAAMRHAYENTDTPLPRVAAEFKIGITTLQRLRDKEGWAKRSERVRDVPREARLLEAARALGAAQAHPPDLNRHAGAAAPTGPRFARPDGELRAALEEPAPDLIRGCTPQNHGPPSFEDRSLPSLAPQNDESESMLAPLGSNPALSPLDRLEALVVKEIAAEEAVRVRLQGEPRRRAEAERCARTLSILAQTLRSLQQQRCGHLTDDETTYDDMPADIDEFRRELARRIEAFVASRTDAGDAEQSVGPAALDEV